MTLPRLNGFDWISVARTGTPYRLSTTQAPWRVVLHTTETPHGTARTVSHRYPFPPHVTIDPATKERYQHVPLDLAAYALKGSRRVETNHARALQVEIVGRANDTHNWPVAWVDWVGQVVGQMCAQVGFRPSVALPTRGAGEGIVLASVASPIRLSPADWLRFSGICGHQHVPDNDHWDPGRLDVVRVLAAASPQTQEDPEMIRPGSSGEHVEDLQNAMAFWGFYKNKSDGVHGPASQLAARQFKAEMRRTSRHPADLGDSVLWGHKTWREYGAWVERILAA